MLNVVSLEGHNWRTFEDMESLDDQLLASFSGSLFDWSRAWGLTTSDSLHMFLSSLLCNQYLFPSFFSFFFIFSLCLMIFLHKVVFIEYISLLLIKFFWNHS